MFLGIMPANPTIADKFAWAQRWLYNAIGLEFRRRGVSHALQALISKRLGRLVTGMNRVFARWQAGTLRPARVRTSPRPSPQSDAEEKTARKACAWSGLPRGFGWLCKLLPDCAGYVNAFNPVLDDAEMRAIVAAAPQVGRVVRPFCHAMGLPVPDYARLPKRQRVRKSRALRLPEADEEELRRITARFPDTPPARAAKRALRRGFAGLPVNLKKISAVAVGYFLHPPRDGNCPPPEIGYGGRSFPPLPKDYVRPDWD